ncbi:MAG TPA: sigma-70 family RNA polymerase sigma factor [Polyangiaceae bacterium]|nr:sigma-70 family RNA polymerase sigma factor [Polyangiaceae bacterium]
MAAGSVPNSIPIVHSAESLDLDRVYREHASTVSRWLRRLTGKSDVSDALQEVFEVVQRGLPNFRGDAQLSTWLYSITVRVVIAQRRKARLRRLLFARAQAEFDLALEPAASPADNLMRQQATQTVYAVLEHLRERDRALLILFELEGMPITEIAAVLRLTQNNVAVSLHRARERFRARFLRQFPEEQSGANDGKAPR